MPSAKAGGRTAPELAAALSRNLIFVSGKGGVGKTVVSRAIAAACAEKGHRTLWVAFEDPTRPPAELRRVAPSLWHLNCDAGVAFEEYISLKMGGGPLSRIFLKNKLIQYLAKATPGIHELVLLGKVWYDASRYDRVVVDMPSTGHGLAMFQSARNFSILFQGGPIHRDAEAMVQRFNDPQATSHVIVALPEEMPLRESIELNDLLLEMFPQNPAAFLANRLFPRTQGRTRAKDSANTSPVAASAAEYVHRRLALEDTNLKLWRDRSLSFAELEYVPPSTDDSSDVVVTGLKDQLITRGAL